MALGDFGVVAQAVWRRLHSEIAKKDRFARLDLEPVAGALFDAAAIAQDYFEIRDGDAGCDVLAWGRCWVGGAGDEGRVSSEDALPGLFWHDAGRRLRRHLLVRVAVGLCRGLLVV